MRKGELLTADALDAALVRALRTRHRAQLRLAVADIADGSGALSEIDFVRPAQIPRCQLATAGRAAEALVAGQLRRELWL